MTIKRRDLLFLVLGLLASGAYWAVHIYLTGWAGVVHARPLLLFLAVFAGSYLAFIAGWIAWRMIALPLRMARRERLADDEWEEDTHLT